MDLETRLREGPLRVRSVWSSEPPERLAARILRRRRFLFALDAALVCMCVALVSFASWRRGHVGGEASVVMASATFVDGSRADLSSRDSAIDVQEDTPTRVVARLKGGARFQVVPNRQRTFQVQAGEVRVSVLGTTFAVQEVPSGQTHVLVEHGRVEVAWLGGSTVLESGQGGAFPPAVASLDPAASSGAPNSAPLDPSPPEITPPEPAPARAADPSSTRRGWREYALKGDYAKAYDELHANTHEAVRDEAADLMLAADVARLSAHPEQAVQPLHRVCDKHPTDRRAPVAAFTLGRVLLDDLGRPAEAAAAFQKARALWPEGPLVEDSLARESDAWRRAGNRARAHALATQYLARYPQGRHVARIRETLAD